MAMQAADAAKTELNALYGGPLTKLISELSQAGRYEADYAHPVFGDGDAKAPLLLIGEAPGAEEAAAGRPFVGKAGRQLDELFALGGFSRESVYITNVVKYRPVIRSARSTRNRTPSKREIDAFLPLLSEELTLLRPAVIATLGNTPLQAVLTLLDKPVQTVGALHGVGIPIALSGRAITLFPMYHPASGIYNRSLIPIMREDMHKLGTLLGTKPDCPGTETVV